MSLNETDKYQKEYHYFSKKFNTRLKRSHAVHDERICLSAMEC